MNKYIFAQLFATLILLGCSNFEDINTDKNKPTTVTPNMLAAKITLDIVKKDELTNDKLLSKHLAYWENANDAQYNKIGSEGMYFQVISNGDRMIELAYPEDKDAYTGLAILAKVDKMFEVSMRVGDIVYSESGQAELGVIKPKYDPQKDVMIGLLKEIDEAYSYFSKANKNFGGDLIYGGDIEKWKKLCSAMELKILIQLSKKESDPDLNLKNRFSNILTKKVLMQSNSDNCQLVYENKEGMYYPYSAIHNASQTYIMLSSVIIDTLKAYKDYRLFYFGEPAGKLSEKYSESDYNAYIGVDPSAIHSSIKAAQASGMYCKLNKRYTSDTDPKGEPFIRFGYAEQCFNIAEAALRQWIDKDVDMYYKKGIEASMKFLQQYVDKKYCHNMEITDEYIANYLKNPDIQLKGSFEDKLNKIITQKYISSFLQYSYNAYFDYRRTGFPVLPINPASSSNDDGYKDKIPTRWRYRPAEYSSNRENLDKALKRQYNGLDRNNDLMWIIK